MTNEAVIRMFNAIDSSDWETLKTLFHEDIVYERPGYPPFAGRDRVLQFYKSERIIASGKHHLDQIVVKKLRFIDTDHRRAPAEPGLEDLVGCGHGQRPASLFGVGGDLVFRVAHV